MAAVAAKGRNTAMKAGTTVVLELGVWTTMMAMGTTVVVRLIASGSS